MSRPTANILKSTRDETGTQWDLLEGNNLYIVVYNDKPFNVRRHIQTLKTEGYKYYKLSYTSEAPAINQAIKLNKLFQTLLFTVKKVA